MARFVPQSEIDKILQEVNNADPSNPFTRDSLIDTLIQRGNTIEGVNDTQQVPKTTDVPTQDPSQLPVGGQSVPPTSSVAQVERTPSKKELENRGTLSKVAGFLGIENLGKRIGSELVRFTPEGRELQRLREQGLVDEETYRDIVTGGVTNRQAVGSALSLAANLALPGAGGVLAKGTATVARAAGAARVAQGATRVADAANKVNLSARIVRGKNVADTAKNVGKAVGKSAALGLPFGFGEALQDEQEKGVLGRTLQSAIIAGAFPIAGAAVRATGRAIAKGAKLSAMALSRTPEKAIQYAIENPQLASQGVNRAKNDPNLVFKVAREAELATNAIKTKRDRKFAKGLAKVDEKLTGKEINPEPFNKKLEEALRKFDMLTPNGRINRDGIISDTREVADIQKILERMGRQKDLTPSGYWKLKRFISNKYRPTASGEFNALITSMDNDLRDVMVREIPEMDKLFKNFENDSAILGILKKELGLQGQAKGITLGDNEIVVNNSSKRVINALRRAGRDNQELLGELIKEMEKRSGTDITADLMGLYFKDFLPPIGFNFLAGIGVGVPSALAVGAGVAPVIAASSPRAVGAISRTVGRAQQGLRNIAPAIEGGRTIGRQAIFGGLRNVTGE